VTFREWPAIFLAATWSLLVVTAYVLGRRSREDEENRRREVRRARRIAEKDEISRLYGGGHRERSS
jgi:hypothetical protein